MLKNSVIVFGITLFLSFLIDFFLGDLLLKEITQYTLNSIRAHQNAFEKAYRISDKNFHHTLSPNFIGKGQWGSVEYLVCTNPYGFKSKCGMEKSENKEFDIAFMGDSFTEGVSLSFEDSFVGKIASTYPTKRIANLAVVSYSPTIYLSKIKWYLEHGFKFAEVVLYVDVSDIQDEAIVYSENKGELIYHKPENEEIPVVENGKEVSHESSMKQLAKKYFPLTFHSLHLLKYTFLERPETPFHYVPRNRAAWTYNPKAKGYGNLGIEGGIQKSLAVMTELHLYLKERNIPLSIGVYPWPDQILFDEVHSRHVKVWENFCLHRCKKFYNSFPTFFNIATKTGKEETVKDYFIQGDIHFNALGNELIARDFIKLQNL
ncbi:hypothetical protein EHQ58_06420 [Leptospira ognonensis]|uniref:SGNH/GDSL hydrolase family protein n=1 Tax=Leptospira ognonensis TaxID=2484945 RepID=A0A4R9K2A1_9LEPT|nr:hypothetical protein [Leptospira ognonensis]TGL60132.1 hypothetical protein EHQ58_06420 [Leptospira ognonensis]